MTFFMRMRLRRGIRWGGKYPPVFTHENVRTLLLVTVAVALVLWAKAEAVATTVGTDYAHRLAEVTAVKDQYRDALLSCLNHGFVVFDHEAFACKAEPLGVVQ